MLLLSHSFSPDIGGIETMSELLARRFSELGHEIHVITWSKDDKEDGTFPFTIIRDPSVAKLFKEYFWTDVILENNPCLKLAWPAIFFLKPHIIVLQTWIENRYKRMWLKHAKKVIACSASIRENCWPSALVIGNSYNTEIFRLSEKAERNKDFVFVGRLVSDKGAELTIKALHLLQTKFSNQPNGLKRYCLTIIGDGPEKIKLEELAASLHMQDCVQFRGALRGKELADCLNQHRFILVPSIWDEPFGIVALEGIACGCLPIVSDSGGLPEAIGNAGLTFNKGNADDLVRCIKKLLDYPELEQQLRNAARNHLVAYHPYMIAKKYLDVIEDTAKMNK